MIQPENLLLLHIGRSPGGPLSWHIQVQMNHQTLEPAIRVDEQRLRTIHLLVEGLRRTLVNPAPQDLVAEGLAGVGLELFDLGLASHWSTVQKGVIPGLPLRLVIISSIPEVLNLPWEVIRLPDGRVLGLDEGVGLRRLPHFDAKTRHCCSLLPPRPFRLLFALSAPADTEETSTVPIDSLTASFLEAMASARGDLLFEMATTGTVAELRERIHRLQPQMVFLCGPVRIHRGEGFFGFEAEDGRMDIHSSHEMVQELLQASGVQCLLLSGLSAGKAPPIAATGAVCAAAVGAGVPLAIAWPSIDAAFMAPFFRGVAWGLPIEAALNQARTLCRTHNGEQAPPTWILPMLYGESQQGFLFNVAEKSAVVRPQQGTPLWSPLPGMNHGVTGSFHGRRPEASGLLATLQERGAGLMHISGPRESGKSTLAVRLARELAAGERPRLAMAGTPANPLTAARLLQYLVPVLKRLGFKDEVDQLKDGSLSIRHRLATLVTLLTTRQGVILLLDDLDPWPTPGDQGDNDPDLAWFFSLFWQRGPGETCILVTGQNPLICPENLPPWVTRVTLEPLSLTLLAGIALGEHALLTRLPAGPQGWAEIRAACQAAQGHPAWIRPILATHPDSDTPSSAQDPLALFFASWPVSERLQLGQAALPHLALPTEGMLDITGVQTETLFDWRSVGLLVSWHTPGGEILWKVAVGIADWVTRPENLPDAAACEAHRRIGDYLVRLFEGSQEEILGLTWVDVLLEARFHWAQAGELDTAVALSGKVSHGLEIQGLFAELERINRPLLLWGVHPSPHFWLAQSCLGRGELEQALEWFQRGRQPAQEKYRVEQAAAWQGEAEIHLAKGRLEAARNGYHAAMLLLQAAGDREGEATMATQVAAVHVRQGALEKATSELHHALALQEEVGDRTGSARTLSRLAEVDLARHDADAAGQKLRLALTVQETINDPVGESTTRALWGMLELQRQRPEQALAHFERAIVLYQELGHVVDLASTLPVAGHLLYTLQRFSESRHYFAMVIPLLRHLEQNAMLASVQHQMGVMDLLEGSLESALVHLREALLLRGQIGDRAGESATLFQLGQLARVQGLEEGSLRLIGLSWRLDGTKDALDVGPEETLFWEIAQELFLTPPQANALLEQLWNDYLTDGSHALFQTIFASKEDPYTAAS
ncbi:MAG: CHAT domain-containing protein [Magnetococcales bacterium]|nr:CHAT domain-containing protein [Magnetococcales bacterium]